MPIWIFVKYEFKYKRLRLEYPTQSEENGLFLISDTKASVKLMLVLLMLDCHKL